MGFADQYFEKQKDFKPHIKAEPQTDLRFVIVIPCYHENNLIYSLRSLYNCSRPEASVEVIIVINSSSKADNKIKEHNLKTFKEAEKWIKVHSDKKFRYYIIYAPDLPPKFAGAGMARKIGMDEAVSRFNLVRNKSGIIISFDADSICDNNYLSEIENHFNKYPETDGCSIYFEHPVSGNDFSADIYRAITLYELHLRYYVQSLRYISFPYAFHTIGSCFAVNALAYIKQGGMNKRKAGEDFYFLHKIIPLGKFMDVNSTRVVPSSRPSVRVPFGTGSAISRLIMTGESQFMTYNPASFEALQEFLKIVPRLFKTNAADSGRKIKQLLQPVREFLQQNNAVSKINEINDNSNNINSFCKRLLSWFNAFTVLKFLNFCTREHYPDINIVDAVNTLLRKLELISHEITDERDLLEILRHYERNQVYSIPSLTE